MRLLVRPLLLVCLLGPALRANAEGWLIDLSVKGAADAAKAAGLQPARTYRHFSWAYFRGAEEAEARFTQKARASGLRVAPNTRYHLLAPPNDPLYDQQADLNPLGELAADGDMHVQAAWGIRNSAENVVVAIIDSGMQITHEDLSPNLWTNQAEANGEPGVDDDGNGYVDDLHGWNAVDDNPELSDSLFHGTRVAGVLGARGDNGIGVAGTCWRIQMLPVRAFSDQETSSEILLAALDYVLGIPEVRIINASWGSGEDNEALYEAFRVVQARGIMAVCGAGNGGHNNDEEPFYPGSYGLDNIISVAAVNLTGELASFSNYGSSVEVAAQGSDVLTTDPYAGYYRAMGTSFATPRVTGAVALMMAEFPGMSASVIRNRIIETSRWTAALAGASLMGGLIDFAPLLEATPTTVGRWTAYP
ncbi:MAG TPA: S8 family peptidase [Candidatus Sumerlaeota bacterium]|nr:S8 family peptidase [Candidatus Sumerlaeota bacterium]